ncbi:MAG: SDR family oxidoreductase [Acidobacteriota bacterium]
MQVFVTGTTGFIGSAIAQELRLRGHDVVGLARSDRSADALRTAGFKVQPGDIADPDSVISALSHVDAVIHTAFNHDFSRYVENCEADGRLLDAIASALEGTHKALIATSATTVTATDRVSTEEDRAVEQVPRSASEAFLPFADRGVRAAVVRLPPTVHGAGDTAFVPALIALARERGFSAYIGEGANRWPAVHRDDAARLFCDAVEQPRLGVRYHGVAETGISFRTIAETIGQGLGVPTESLPAERAGEHFGWLAMFAALDGPASSEWTREATGWEPREGTLIDTLHTAGYFEAPAS